MRLMPDHVKTARAFGLTVPPTLLVIELKRQSMN